jgi:peptide/nickel transport system substrate-binding protein
VQRLINAAETGPKDQQVSNMQQTARIIAQDAAADWLFLLPNLIVATPDIKGLPVNRIGESFELAPLSRTQVR